MRSVEIRNGRLFYYGSAVGYLEGDGLTADPMSAVRTWKGGWSVKIFRSAGWMECTTGWPTGSPQNAQPLKSLRIWQLKPDTPIEMLLHWAGSDGQGVRWPQPEPIPHCL